VEEQSKEEYIKNKRKNIVTKRRVAIFLIILIVLLFLISVIIGIKLFTKNKEDNNNKKHQDEIISQEEEQLPEIVPSEIPYKMEEVEVLGAISIYKLGLQKNILDKTTDSSLSLSVTKFYGPNINEKGNFCITGHNYKNIFAYLDNLELGDTFYIVDKKRSEKVTYKIYDKYTVNPNELECLNQDTDGKREVTLITCNPGGLTRLILKAREI